MDKDIVQSLCLPFQLARVILFSENHFFHFLDLLTLRTILDNALF